jgi:hypothetical protein
VATADIAETLPCFELFKRRPRLARVRSLRKRREHGQLRLATRDVWSKRLIERLAVGSGKMSSEGVFIR